MLLNTSKMNVNRSDMLPPTTVSKKVRESKEWKMAMLDSFEYIARDQFKENLKFQDAYRMERNQMSFQELKDIVPNMANIQEFMDGFGLSSFIKHHDIVGGLVRDIIGKFKEVQDKFHVTELGEVAQNEFLRQKDDQIIEDLNEIIDRDIETFMAKQGYSKEGQKFSSPEEQQAYIQKMDEIAQSARPKDTDKSTRSTFKTIGMEWGEHTLEDDIEKHYLEEKDTENMRDKILSGRCFRHYNIKHENYEIENWDARQVFFSKESDSKYTQDGEYVGRMLFPTPNEVIKKWGYKIPTNIQKEILGGRDGWKEFVGPMAKAQTLDQGLKHNFTQVARVPFGDYFDYSRYIDLQDITGEPMGINTTVTATGKETVSRRYLPTVKGNDPNMYGNIARLLRDDFEHRRDLCVAIEVYCIVYEKWGLLCYEDENGSTQIEEVTEDILKDFLKENNITQKYNETLVDIIDKESVPGTLQWVYRPFSYRGEKITSGNLQEPLYLSFERCEHQITGEHFHDTKLPVAGHVGKDAISKAMPFQVKHNLAMNQLQSLAEKEIGIFFLMDVGLIPSDMEGWGDANDALVNMMQMAKDLSVVPVKTSGDFEKNENHFNQFATHNLSLAPQMSMRLQMAKEMKQMAYEAVIGSSPGAMAQNTQYTTDEGIKVGQETVNSQLADVFADFDNYKKRALELHLSVAQYCQINKKDKSLMFTKSDQSVVFLNMSDPLFPLRRMGIIPAKSGKKRKEFESYKTYLLNNNTTETSFLEVAELIASEDMQTAIKVGKEQIYQRLISQEKQHQREIELADKQGQIAEIKAQKDHERALEKVEKEGVIKIGVAETGAAGRAADKDANADSYKYIRDIAAANMSEVQHQSKVAIEQMKVDNQKTKDQDSFKLKMAELKLKSEKIKADIEMKNKDVAIATIND